MLCSRSTDHTISCLTKNLFGRGFIIFYCTLVGRNGITSITLSNRLIIIIIPFVQLRHFQIIKDQSTELLAFLKKYFSPMEEESQRLLLGQRKSPSPSGLGSSSFCVDSDHHVVEEERQQVRLEGVPPPPPPPLPTTSSQYTKISSLDFERVVNEFSIQATRDRFLLDGEIQQQQQQQQLQQQRKQGLFHEGYGSTMSEITHSTSAFHLMTPKKRKRKPRRTTGRTATRWFLSTAVGLLTGLTTILIATCTESFVAWRAKILDEWTREDEEFPLKRHYIFVIFTIINLLMATSASVLCVYWAPEGSGSGIPEYVSFFMSFAWSVSIS